MNLIECNHCKKKYPFSLKEIPKTPKKWKCPACQQISPFPFYSEKEQEFLIKVEIYCKNCKKQYAIPSCKFIASKMRVLCSSCKNKFEIYFSNFENIQKLNQKISSYLNEDKQPTNKIPLEDKKQLQQLAQEFTKNTPKKQDSIATESNDQSEDLQSWENKIKQQKGIVSANARSSLFIPKIKEQKLNRSDIPALSSKEQDENNYPKKKNISTSFFLFVLFSLIVILYIYITKF